MKAILVDDEPLALDILEKFINENDEMSVVAKITNPHLAIKEIIQQDVNVVFLDINLPGINGLEMAEIILGEKPNLIIIFITAHAEYALQAFDVHALDYLVKPITDSRIRKTINRVKNKLNAKKDVLKVIHLKMCNHFAINVNNDTFETISWRTAKVQEVFLYLMHNREKIVRKSTLIDLLWSETDPDRAYSQLYNTIYNVRKGLKRFQEHFQLKSTSEGYILYTSKNILIDIDDWKKDVSSLPKLNWDTINLYKDAMYKYTGAYLNDYDYWWAEGDRYKYEQLWQKVAFEIADFYFEQSKLEDAKTWYLKICNESLSERAYLSLMKIHAAEQNYEVVNRVYDRLKEKLQDEYNVKPSGKVTSWYMNWLSERNFINSHSL